MKKEKVCFINLLLPLLLLLIFSINVSLAKPMKITQQTTGEYADVNKEFIYYIPRDSTYINTEDYPNVELVNVKNLMCGCRKFSVMNIDPRYDAKIIEHNHPLTGCNYGSTVYDLKYYKIKLKNNETISLNTIKEDQVLYIIPIENYNISYQIETNNTSIKKDDSLLSFKFTSSDNKIVILRQSFPYIPITMVNTMNIILPLTISIMTISLIIYYFKNKTTKG